MKTRKRIAWIASALATLVVALVLIGCPHNGMLSVHSGDTGNSSLGGRVGNDSVTLIITNFTSDGASGPLRTIAPDNIDLKNDAAKQDLIFLASGTSNNGETFGPVEITIEDTTGKSSLPIAGDGVWTVTVEAYSKNLLQTKHQMADPDTSTVDECKKIVEKKDDCAVLTGTATVVLGTGASVSLTLTNDGVGSAGQVEVTIKFNTERDRNKINDNPNGQNKLKVKVALHDYTTGGVQQLNTEKTVHDGMTEIGDSVDYNVPNVPKGHYQFRVTVVDAQDAVKAYWADDIFVEGNRTTKQEVHITNLFNDPTQPTGFEAYWTPPQTGELKDGFLSYFVWSGLSYNTAGLELELADITKWYEWDADKGKVGFDQGQKEELLDHGDLWDVIDGTAGSMGNVNKADVVTTLTWDNTPQGATTYPIWKNGSLLNGSGGITLLMQTGHVYSARIRAKGATGDSAWLILGDAPDGNLQKDDPEKPNGLTGVPNNKGGQALIDDDKFKQPTTNGLFDLVRIKYDLQDKYLLYKGTTIADDVKAKSTDLLEYVEYEGGQSKELKLKYAGNDMTGAPQAQDWVLYPKTMSTGQPPATGNDRIQTWDGWKDTLAPGTTREFGPQKPAGNPWKYSGHTDLVLIPTGASGSLDVKAETSGTFNVLGKDKVLVDITANGTGEGQPWNVLENGTDNPVSGSGDIKNTKLGLGEDTQNSRFIINLDKAAKGGTGGNPTWLHVTVGKDTTPDNQGKLDDRNGSPFNVVDIKVTISQGGSILKTFDKGNNGYTAKAKLDGMASGDYTFRVEIKTGSGYWVSYQTPLALKYSDQTIQ